jgi:hypothetical protein
MSLYIPSLLVGRWGEARITQINESLGNLLVAMGVEGNGLWLKQSQNLPWHWTSALSVQLQMTHCRKPSESSPRSAVSLPIELLQRIVELLPID